MRGSVASDKLTHRLECKWHVEEGAPRDGSANSHPLSTETRVITVWGGGCDFAHMSETSVPSNGSCRPMGSGVT
jgi:hypothetical protein